MGASRLTAAVGVGALLLGGILGGIALKAVPREGSAPAATASPAAVSARGSTGLARDLDALRGLVDEERAQRLALAAEVRQLREALERIAAVADGDAPDPASFAESEPAAEPTTPLAGDSASQSFFDEAKLLAAGVRDWEAERLRERYEAAELAELYLRDRAAREGWLRKPRYRRGLRAIQDELRAEVGDEDYDWMLYAAGQPNRVKLSHVLESSPGFAAGLRSGDVVVAYGGERIFTPRDLVDATTAFEAGVPVRVLYVRDGERRDATLPAGPIGSLTRPVVRQP